MNEPKNPQAKSKPTARARNPVKPKKSKDGDIEGTASTQADASPPSVPPPNRPGG